jgi:hypothetical protein
MKKTRGRKSRETVSLRQKWTGVPAGGGNHFRRKQNYVPVRSIWSCTGTPDLIHHIHHSSPRIPVVSV